LGDNINTMKKNTSKMWSFHGEWNW
jgi:hypothetical protein